MHGKCLNYKVFLQKKSGTYFYEYIYNKTAKTKKTQAKSLDYSFAGLSSCCESWSPRFPFILLNYNSAPPLLLRADVGQLFSSWPAFTPGGGILRISWAIALLCVVWDLQKSGMILEGSCQLWIRCWKLALCIGTMGAGSMEVLCWC